MTQTLIAFLIAYSGDKAVEYITRGAKDAWSTEKILTVLAGSMLAVYAVKLTHEYFTEGGEDENEEENKGQNDAKGQYTPAAASESQAADVEGGTGVAKAEKPPPQTLEIDGKAAPEEDKKEEDNRSQTLFVIAFIGSVDDLTLFVPMLVGKGFNLVQLMLGSFLAVISIIFICIFLGLCKPFADFVEKIPLAAIVVVFAVYLLGKACFME